MQRLFLYLSPRYRKGEQDELAGDGELRVSVWALDGHTVCAGEYFEYLLIFGCPIQQACFSCPSLYTRDYMFTCTMGVGGVELAEGGWYVEHRRQKLCLKRQM